MRTTLSIDDDVIMAAKAMASFQHKSVGEVISALARQALRSDKQQRDTRNGISLLPLNQKAVPVTTGFGESIAR